MKALLAAALLCSLALGPAAAQPALTTITLGLTSRTAGEWPEFVADAQGYYAQNGLVVEKVTTGSAAAGAQQLTAGSLDISEASSTQTVEAIVGGAPLVMIAVHAAKAPYAVLGKKGITSLAALKGKTIIVGGPNDITRVFMDKVLASAKLGPEDYIYTYSGATVERFAALSSGGVDAAILYPPFSYRAASLGFPVLADVSKFFPTFLFDTFAVRQDWGKSHADLVVRYLKAYLQAVRWLNDPANRAAAIRILSDATNTTPEDAAQTYDVFITKEHVFTPDGLMTNGLLQPVLDALVKIGALKPPLPPPARFYDNSYAASANAQLRRR